MAELGMKADTYFQGHRVYVMVHAAVAAAAGIVSGEVEESEEGMHSACTLERLVEQTP